MYAESGHHDENYLEEVLQPRVSRSSLQSQNKLIIKTQTPPLRVGIGTRAELGPH